MVEDVMTEEEKRAAVVRVPTALRLLAKKLETPYASFCAGQSRRLAAVCAGFAGAIENGGESDERAGTPTGHPASLGDTMRREARNITHVLMVAQVTDGVVPTSFADAECITAWAEMVWRANDGWARWVIADRRTAALRAGAAEE